MRISCLTAITALLAMTSAAPVAHSGRRHQHIRRQDWAAIDWSTVDYDFSNVDWSTVNYDLSNVDWATVFNTEATTTAAAASTAQTEAVEVNNNVVQVAATTTATLAVQTTTSAQAGNVAQATATASSSTTTSSSSKRGLSWDSSSSASIADMEADGVNWYFNWSPLASSDMPSAWEFYANIWGSGNIEDLADNLSGSPKLIGFNEPDSATQSNLDVSEAISLYQQYLVPLKTAGKISELGTPAVTNSDASGEGLDYLSSFVSGCTDCDLDFAVIHWYAEDLDDFKSHVTNAYTVTGLPINVAEFAYTSWDSSNEPTDNEVMTFMTEAIAWLDEQDFVTAYAWFGSMYVSEASYPALGSANSLIDEAGTALTSLGEAYCQ